VIRQSKHVLYFTVKPSHVTLAGLRGPMAKGSLQWACSIDFDAQFSAKVLTGKGATCHNGLKEASCTFACSTLRLAPWPCGCERGIRLSLASDKYESFTRRG
jgi:hypothetical protein